MMEETLKPKCGRWWKAGFFVLFVLCIPVIVQWQSARLDLRRVMAEYERRGDSLNWKDVVVPVPEAAANGKDDYSAAIADVPEIPYRWLGWNYAVPGAVVPLSQVTIPVQIVEYPDGFPLKLPMEPKSVHVITNIWPELETKIFDGATNWMHAERAATNDVIDMNVDWSLGPGVRTPHVIGTRKLMAWTRAAVIHGLRKGERDSALRRLMVGWRLLEIHDEPELITALVRIAGAHVLAQATWELLVHDGWSDDQLAALQMAVDKVRFVESMDRAIRQERCAGFQLWHQWREDPSQMAKYYPPEMREFLPKDMKFTQSEDLILKHPWIWRSFVSHGDLAWMLANYHLALEELRAGWKARSQSAYFTAWPDDRKQEKGHLFSRVSCVAFKRSGSKVFRAEAQREFLVTQIAIKRYQLQHGTMPTALGDLVPNFLPDLPVDWMDGKPLRYRRFDPQHYLLWSVGGDGVDDGGIPTEFGMRVRGGPPGKDWVWPRIADELETQAYLDQRRKELGLP